MLEYVTTTVNAMHGDDVDAQQERALVACSERLVQACAALRLVCERDRPLPPCIHGLREACPACEEIIARGGR